MARKNKLTLTIDVNSKKGREEIKKTRESLGKFHKEAKDGKKTFKSYKKTLLATTAILTSIALVIKKTADAFGVQEKAVNDLAQAMKNAGTLSREALTDMQNFASMRQELTTFGDEVTLSNLALLQTFGMTTEQMKKSTIAAQDFSVGLGIDLRSATLLVGKAFAGDTATLARYGIILEEGLSKADKFTAVLGQLGQRFGGRAEAELKTYAGQVKNLALTWGDLQENIGRFIVPSLLKLATAVNKTIKFINSALSDGEQDMKDFGTSAQVMSQTTIKALSDMGVAKKQVEDLRKSIFPIDETQQKINKINELLTAVTSFPMIDPLNISPEDQKANAKLVDESEKQMVSLMELGAELRKKQRAKEAAEEEKQFNARLAVAGQFASASTSLFSNLNQILINQGKKKNKRLFMLEKAANIAMAIVNTATAVTSALKTPPPPVGIALAGVVGAAGAAQVGVIASTKMARGGVVDGSRGGVLNRSTMVEAGEGRTSEAFVPLPDNKRIPVKNLDSGKAPITIVNFTDPRAFEGYIASQIAAGMRVIPNIINEQSLRAGI